MTGKWITNSPEAAEALRRADRAFDAEMLNTRGLALADKIVAIRCCQQRLDQAYQRIANGDYT